VELNTILKAGQSREPYDQIISFKLTEQMKTEFVDYCLRNNLSMGSVRC
jgi:hypothetical protein